MEKTVELAKSEMKSICLTFSLNFSWQEFQKETDSRKQMSCCSLSLIVFLIAYTKKMLV